MTRAIILEGPDESGKSTLAKRLLDLTDRSVISIGPRPTTREAALVFCGQFLHQIFQDVIMDRCTPISELVYRQVFGGYVVTPQELWDILDTSHRYAKPVFVYCRPKWINPPQPKQGYDTPELIQILRDSFASTLDIYGKVFDEMTARGFNVVRYDYFSKTPEELLKEVESCTSTRS